MKTKRRDVMYSMGNLSSGLAGQAVGTFAIFYYTDRLHVPVELISLAMVLYGIWNAINDPLFGQISDRTRTRWGRRIPYVRFLSLPLAVAFALLWMPPFRAGSAMPLFWYYIVMMFLFDSLFTFVILNWTALFPEMYSSLEERTRVSAWRQVLGIVGMVLGIAVPPLIYGTLGWPAMGLIFGVFIALGLMLSLAGSHENPEFAAEPALPFGQALKATFANWSFLSYVLASMMIQFTFTMLTATLPFYAKYVLGVSEAQTSLLLGAIFAVALPMIYVWSRLTTRYGARRALILAVLAYGLLLIPLLFVHNLLQAVLTTALLGIGIAGILLLLDVLIADVIDEDELKTGVRREGMYFGVNGFLIRLGISLQAVMMGFVLKRTGYNPALAMQPAAAVWGLRVLVGVIPIVGLLIALALLRAYPLDGARLQEVRNTLRGKRAA
ncbi:MAG: MFS transporter [Firmicutes bacterium]|nr:MFS transporter [Bacillota bacterium]